MKTPGFPVTFVSPIPGHLGLQKLVASFSEGLFVILISPVKIFGNNVGNLGLGESGRTLSTTASRTRGKSLMTSQKSLPTRITGIEVYQVGIPYLEAFPLSGGRTVAGVTTTIVPNCL